MMTDVDDTLETYLVEMEVDDDPTIRLVKSHSSPTIEMQVEALAMCLEILSSVPEPNESTEKLLWRHAQQAARECKKEISRNDINAEWKAAPMASRSAQNSRKVTHKGFRIRKEIK